jgi:6-phosphogluconate dehydrogenase
MNKKLCDIGVIGLGVMGKNLIFNLAEKGISVAVFNRTKSKIDNLKKEKDYIEKKMYLTHSLDEFVSSLKSPKIILLMVKSGKSIDEIISKILPFLKKGDFILDGGNSYYKDTMDRSVYLKKKGIHFYGIGISGGEKGARFGPSIMVGGEKEAWKNLKPIFQKIAARSKVGDIACDFLSENGAGHYVKMVHNGIEYADMQLISESYSLLKNLVTPSNTELSSLFHNWNTGKLNSYLIEITSKILAKLDTDGKPLLEKVSDIASQKGTGKWVVKSALDLNVSLQIISSSVFARNISTKKEIRRKAGNVFPKENKELAIDKNAFCDRLQNALYMAKILSYDEGFNLLKKASTHYAWDLDLKVIAKIWSAGCIIRSDFLKNIEKAFEKESRHHLIFDQFFIKQINQCYEDLKRIVEIATVNQLPIPCFSSALAYFEQIRSFKLSTNLVQAMRDFFGAHMYERIDKEKDVLFHSNWE